MVTYLTALTLSPSKGERTLLTDFVHRTVTVTGLDCVGTNRPAGVMATL